MWCTTRVSVGTKIVDKYKVSRQLLAGDSGLYESFKPKQAAADEAVQNLEICCRELKHGCRQARYKLNDDKTEAAPCGSMTQQSQVSVNSICVGE